MRKALIAVAVATALFAVGAFAASFAVNSEDIASGEDDVEACADQVDIDFDPDLDPVTGHWNVTTVTVTFLTTADDLDTGCDEYDAELALDLGADLAGAVYASVDTAIVDGSSVEFTLDPARDVETIWGASVVVDGKTLSGDV